MTIGSNLGRQRAPLTRDDVVTAHLEALAREQQSIPGWRRTLEKVQALLAALSGVKGASAHRHMLDEVRYDVNHALLGSDMAVLRNSTSTADLALAMAEADRLLPGKAWLIGRGRSRPGEPLYGFAVFETRDDISEGQPLVMVEHEDIRMCVQLAVEKIKGLGKP